MRQVRQVYHEGSRILTLGTQLSTIRSGIICLDVPTELVPRNSSYKAVSFMMVAFGWVQLTCELRRVGIQPEEVRRTFDHRNLLLRKLRKTIAENVFHTLRIISLVDGIL